MKSHLRSIAKRKVADFLTREEGMVGNRSAFAAAAFVGTTSLAMTLLVPPSANAGCDCDEGDWCCTNGAELFFCSENFDPEYNCWVP